VKGAQVVKKCIGCDVVIEGEGYDAAPLREGVLCSQCNQTRAFLEKIPPGDPDCPECGGVGWVFDYYSDDPDDYQVGRCGLCMPPSFVIGPGGIRQGDPELDCEDIGGRRVRKS
jgi:hypothetical protein